MSGTVGSKGEIAVRSSRRCRVKTGATPRIFVCTLYSGENEFEECLASLQKQAYTNWEHKIIDHLPNKEAHDTLYREFMTQNSDFDLFLKLDADMVFRHDDALSRLVEIFEANPMLDHLETGVYDWFTDGIIMGLHTYSKRAIWHKSDEALFVDPFPIIPGIRKRIRHSPAPLVNHAPNPSPYQAFYFGVHRALKAVQPGRKFFDFPAARHQWFNLKQVWKHFVKIRDVRLGLAVIGASMVFEKRISRPQDKYDNNKLIDAFESVKSMEADELFLKLQDAWSSSIRRNAFYIESVGLRRYSFGILFAFARKVSLAKRSVH